MSWRDKIPPSLQNGTTLVQALTDMGIKLDVSIQLLTSIAQLTSIPLKAVHLHEAAEQVLEILVRELGDVQASSILLFDPVKGLLELLAARGQADLVGELSPLYNRQLSFLPGEGIAGRVFSEKQPCFWDKNSEKPAMIKLMPGWAAPVSLACLPLSTFERCIGVLNISFNEIRPFDVSRRRDMVLLSGVVANIVQTFVLKQEIDEKAASLLSARDELEQRVEERTAELSLANESLRVQIAERQRAEKANLESQKRYELAAEAGKVSVFDLNLVTGEMHIDPKLMTYLGYGEREIGENVGAWLSLVHPQDRDDLKQAVVDRQGSDDYPLEREHRMIHKDGSLRWFLSRGSIIRDGTGQPCRLVGTSTDITDRKRAQTALKESEERYRSLVERTSDGFFIFEMPTGRFLFLNRRVCDLFGYSQSEALGKTIWDFIAPADIRAYIDRLDLLLRQDKTAAPQTFTALGRDGKSFRAEISASRVTFKGQTVIQGVIRDITEQERLKQQLFTAQKMEAVGALAGGISHDFNNILAAIIGYTQLVQANTPEDSRERQNLDQVVSACKRARDLIRQILAFSRRTEVKKQPLFITPTVKEALKLLRASIPATIEINQDFPEEQLYVAADPTQMHQVVMNLCTNAAQAMREKGGVLTVGLAGVAYEPQDPKPHQDMSHDRYVRLMVADTGPGMEPAVLERIFEPYFTTSKQEEGTGLGLSVVHGIVRNHGGAVTVSSEPDKGSVFYVYLPRIESEADLETAGPTFMAGGRESILVVDDEQSLAEYLKQFLEGLGYKVTACTGSFAALACFRENPDDFDLVLTDLTMPKMNGLDLARAINRLKPDLPIILSTGSSGEPEAELVVKAGIRSLLIKPLMAEELARTIREVLDGYSG